jgi:hypothetical protein
MYRTMFSRLTAAAAALAAILAAAPSVSAQEAAEPADIQVQRGGPIHEAFAQPVQANPQPGPLIGRQPPAPVPEQPPDQRPEGANVVWIPGYWAWDAERNDFLWVSGIWRNAPPGQDYVAGYWKQEGGRWRWVSGFWSAAGQDQVAYDPAPPDSVDNGPAAPAPDDGSIYSPGYWVYQASGYVWRPGFWQAGRPGLVWVPAHYVWTPSGCVFVAGYWDYDLEDRGLLFASVVFRRPLWLEAGWTYCPSYVVEIGPLLDCLFVGPACVSYYYGDCYRLVGGRWGYQPWILWGPHCYDPLFTYYRFHNRGNPRWEGTLRQVFLDRAAGRAAMPARTVTPLARFSSPGVHLTEVTAAQRQAHLTAAERFTRTVTARRQTETKATTVLRSSGGNGQRSTTVTRKVETPRRVPAVTASVHPAPHPTPAVHVPASPPSPARVVAGKEVLMSKTANLPARSVTTRTNVVNHQAHTPVAHSPAREARTLVQQKQIRITTAPARPAPARPAASKAVHRSDPPPRPAQPAHSSPARQTPAHGHDHRHG